MLRTNHASGLHDLLLEQVNRSETLMNDNALMQRQLYKYETTLAELDVILRSEKRDQQVFELKKMIEGQLKQIVVLQKEIELVRQGQTITNSCSQSQLQPTASKQEVDGLKYQIDDLVHERDNLVEMAQNFEGQFKESHQNMQQAMSRV